jgi:phage/plasmid-associated DNA primase
MARLNIAGKFTEPASSGAERKAMHEQYSPLQEFIDEACELGTGEVTASLDVYDAYHTWAVQNREDRILPRRAMVGAFKDATRGKGCRYGSHRVDGQIVRGFKGLTITRPGQGAGAAFTPQVVK